MPLRSRATLLAGIAAFVGLVPGVRPDRWSRWRRRQTRPGEPIHAALFHRLAPAEAATTSSPAAAEGTVIASSNPLGVPPHPSAPAPLNGGEASVWQPVQRVTAEKAAIALSETRRHAGVRLRPAGRRDPGVHRHADPATRDDRRQRRAERPPPIRPCRRPSPIRPPSPRPCQPRLEPQPVVVIAPPILAHPAAPREFAKQPLPPYVVEPPDILLVQATANVTLPNRPIDGQHLVRPDGTISLGIYGSVYVAGSTLEEVRDAVAAQIHVSVNKLNVDDIKKGVVADVLAYNSKVYYVITDGAGYGEQVTPSPMTGNETVLDALSKINGLPPWPPRSGSGLPGPRRTATSR